VVKTDPLEVGDELSQGLAGTDQLVAEGAAQPEVLIGRVGEIAHGSLLTGHGRARPRNAPKSTLAYTAVVAALRWRST